MRKVAWPSRAETTNYSVIVLITLIALIGGIFVIDFFCARGALYLFK